MTPQDRELLEYQCTDCHDLNRVFLMRGSASKWEELLNLEHHQEIGFDLEEIDELLIVFKKYLHKP